MARQAGPGIPRQDQGQKAAHLTVIFTRWNNVKFPHIHTAANNSAPRAFTFMRSSWPDPHMSWG